MKSRMIKALIAAVAILAVIGGTIVLAEPGDTDDPVVTKSYLVDVVVPQLKAYVERKMSGGSSELLFREIFGCKRKLRSDGGV